MTFTTEQKTAIDRHLRKENWLLNEELIAELTDHYAEGIDERLTNGMSFEAALREVHAGFGGRKGLLKMEEGYQQQQFYRFDRVEWDLVKSLLYGSRWYVSVGLFISFFGLNTWLGHRGTVESVSFMTIFYVFGPIISYLIQGIVLFFRIRQEVNPTSLNATSSLFVGLYISNYALLLMNKYLFTSHGYGLSSQSITMLNTLLETLCITYYIAIAITAIQRRKNYLVARKNRLTNAS